MFTRNRILHLSLGLFIGITTFASLTSCKEDTRNYEAEIVSIHFMKRVSHDTVLVVSDTIKPQSTTVVAELGHNANLQQLIPVFTLSHGAKANYTSGTAYNCSDKFSITVTSENERNQRTYKFMLSKAEPPPTVPDPGDQRNAEAWLNDFKLEGLSNVEYEVRGTRIKALVPEGTDITALKPSFTLSEKATSDFVLGETFDFTEPLYIRVTSEDLSTTNTFRISVRVKTPPLHEDAQITAFRFAGTQTEAEIDGSHIYAEAARGSDITGLVPIIKVSKGAKLSIARGEPIDFSQPVKIEVTSEDGAAKSVYIVHTSVKKNSEAKLLRFSLAPLGEPTHMDARRIVYQVLNSVDRTKLIPIFELSPGATADIPLGKILNFKDESTQEMVVTSEDGYSTRVYEIIVEGSDPPAEKGTIVSFNLDCLGAETKEIAGTNITCTVPEGTDVTNLVATFTFAKIVAWSGGSAWLGKESGAKEVQSGVTALDYTNPVKLYIYNTLWGVPHYQCEYTVRVIETQSGINITNVNKLSFEGITTRILRQQNVFYVSVGKEVDIKTLKPVLTLSEGATATLENGKAYDFSSPVDFTVTAKDGKTTAKYRIIVQQRTNDQAELTELKIDELAGKTPMQSGSTFTFFAGADVDIKKLTVRFKLSDGATSNLAPGSVIDCTKPVRIAVTSQDKSITRTYTLVVDQRLNYEADILSFGFDELSSPCKIDGLKISFPAKGLKLNALTPRYTISAGATCTLAQGMPADFSNPVRIVVKSEDGFTSKTYTVTPQLPGIMFNFEKWSNTLGYDNPNGSWTSSNVGLKVSKNTTGIPKEFSIQRTTDAHSGSSAALIKTVAMGGITGKPLASGALFLGTFDASNIISDPLSGPRFGVQWGNVTPSTFTGWYKYIPGETMINGSGTDEFDLYAIVFYGDVLTTRDVLTSERILYRAKISDLSPKSEYTYFEIPFEKLGEAPSGVVLRYTVVATSSREGDIFRGAIGSSLYIDDLEISYK